MLAQRGLMRGSPRSTGALAWWVLASASAVPHGSPAAGQTAAGLVRLDSIDVRGIERRTAGEVVGAAGIQTGVLQGWLDVNRALKNLWATGLYQNAAARLDTASVAGRNILVLEVEELPITRLVRIAGLRSISDDDVLAESGLEEDVPLSRNALARAKVYVREELRRRGVPYVRIDERIRPVPGDDGRVDVVLEIEEGQRVTIAQLAFTGNEHFSDADLQGAMNTKPEGFFWFRSGSYDDIDFGLDLVESLPDHYFRAGFLDFEVLGDTLVIDPETGKARIEVEVSEGPRYRLAELEIEGNNEFDDERLRRFFDDDEGGILSMLGLQQGREQGDGRIFDVLAFEAAAAEVQQLYLDAGYLFAQVQPYWERAGGGGGATVRATWAIREGDQAFVNRVVISGNSFTYDRVIREKIFLLPGDVYSQSRVLQSYQNIQSLGFFETPLPLPDIRATEAGDVDIVFSVEEKQTGSVSFGTAVGGGVGLSGFLGYDQPNLFGQAKAGSVRWDFGQYINSFTLNFTDPALLQSTVSGSVSLFNSTDRLYQFATGRRQRAGFTTRFGVPVPGSLQTRLFFGYSLARTEYEAFSTATDLSLFGLPTGVLSSFSLGITRQTLNHPLFPTSGSMQSWNTELSGGILGGAGDFVKHTGTASWVVPIGGLGEAGAGGVQLAMGVRIRAGMVFGDASGFPFESFWLGGVQFGEPLRGYDETTITPRGYFPEGIQSGISQVERLGDAFLAATAEHKAIVNSNLGLSLFFDAGNLWRHPGDIDVSRLYRGAGFGIQLVTPFGPIGLDYAYGFDRPEPGWQLHFKMGPNF